MNDFEKSTNAEDSSSALLWIFSYVLLLFIFSSISLGFIRSAQLAAFYIPLSILLALRLNSFLKKILFIVNVIFCLIVSSFCGIQGFLYENYEASIDSSFVVEALANTNIDEVVSYIKAGLEELLIWGLSFFSVFFFCTICLIKIAQLNFYSRLSIYIYILVLPGLLAQKISPICLCWLIQRREHPTRLLERYREGEQELFVSS